MSSGTFGYPLCFTAMLVAIGLMVLPRTDEAARKARLENMRRRAIAAEIIARCDDFLRNYPESELSEQVATNAAAQCVELCRWAEVGTRYRELEEKFPRSEQLDLFVFFQGIAMFHEARFEEALPLFNRVRRSFPNSAVAENASYYLAMSYFLNQQNEQALATSHDYLRLYPDGRYAGSLRKRLASIDFNDKQGDQTDKIIHDLTRFVAEHPNDPANGSMLCLIADTCKNKKAVTSAEEETNKNQAIEAYTNALWTDAPVDVIHYALESVIAMHKARNDVPAITALFEAVLKRAPDGFAMDMLRREVAGILKQSIADPASEQADNLIELLVGSFVPRREPSPFDWKRSDGGLSSILQQAVGEPENRAAAARLEYAHARLARLLHFHYRAKPLLNGIATRHSKDPSALSPRLLEICGDNLLNHGDFDGAESMFKRLGDQFPNATNHDSGAVGLGYVALARKQPEAALGIFEEALKKPDNACFQEASLGKARALVELDRLDVAEKLAMVITDEKAFRGETTGWATLELARIYRKQAAKAEGEKARRELLKKAHELYIRVFVSYKGFPGLSVVGIGEAAKVAGELGDEELQQKNLQDLLNEPKHEGNEFREKAEKEVRPGK